MADHKWVPQDQVTKFDILGLKMMARSIKGLSRLTRMMALGSDM